MTFTAVFSRWILVASSLLAVSRSESSAAHKLVEPLPTPKPHRAKKCGIYFAPSTIPGAGMGMFAGDIAYEKGDMVADSDVMIPVFELDWHNDHAWYTFLWNEYTWSPSMFDGMEQEVEDIDQLHACSPGFGAAVNCRLNLVNVQDAEDTWQMGTSGVSSESPGAGAFTPYFGRQFQATKHIPPGMELYVSYGEDYFSSRDAYETVPLRKSFKNADTLLQRLLRLRERVLALRGGPQGDALFEELYNFILNDLPYKSRAMYALPSNVSIIEHVLATGGTANATYNESIRDLDWLEEHGQCMDNIKDGKSTLPHAGRGAFANRFIPKGGLVSPAPLIQIGDRGIFTMYNHKRNRKGLLQRDASSPYHHQMLLNYCFGHNDSSLLLCPYGLLTLLINHSHKNPNAKVEWSKNLRHPKWLNTSYHHWHKTKHSGLSFDIVALRDIEEDEEIFIDYGIEWETAWQEHVAKFDAPRRGYMPAFEMNNQIDLQVKTIYEVDYENIEGIFTFCRKTMVDFALGKDDALADDDDFEVEVKDLWGEGCYPCRVVHRNHNDSYIVELFVREVVEHSSGFWSEEIDHVKYVLFDVPRDTFYFHDDFYMRDHFQSWSFRHDMRIPDEIFPDAWRDSLNPKPKRRVVTDEEEEWEEEEYDEEDDDEDDHQQETKEPNDDSEGDSNDPNRKQVRKKVEGSAQKPPDRHKDEL